jgi:hypothetical protein
MQNNFIDNSVDLLEPILWQYDNAPNLIAFRNLLRDFSREYTTQFWNNFIKDIFRLDTANEFGLSIWGILLGVPRVVTDENGSKLDLEVYRKVLKAKLFILGSNCSTAAFNKYVKMVFDWKCSISDGYINQVAGSSPGEKINEYPSSKDVSEDSYYINRIMTMKYNYSGLDNVKDKDLIAVKDIMAVYPAGVRDNDEHSDILIGLNETATEGQFARNLDDPDAEEENTNRGIIKGGI